METLLRIVSDFNIFFNGLVKFLIPLIFTIYFFAYKEQKDTAISLLKKKIKIFSVYSPFVVISIILVLINVFKKNIKIDGNPNFEEYSIFILTILWILSAAFVIHKVFHLININKIFEKSLEEINKDFKELEELRLKYQRDRNAYNLYKKNKSIESKSFYDTYKHRRYSKKIKKRVEKMNIESEIVFQILLSKKKYNLSNDFSYSLDKIKKNLLDNVAAINSDSANFSFFVPLSGEGYSKLCSITQKGVVDLLNVTILGSNPKDTKLLVDNFTNLKPNMFTESKELNDFWKKITFSTTDLSQHFKDMFDDYYVSAFIVINSLYDKKNTREINIINDLIRVDRESNKFYNGNDLLTLLASLLDNAIENNDLKKMTDIFNAIMEYLHYGNQNNSKFKILSNNNINVPHIKNKMKGSVTTLEEEEKIYKFCTLAVIKCVELGRDRCAGFLIKNILKKFNQITLSKLINDLGTEIDNSQPDLYLSKRLSNLLPINYKFNTYSYKYCFIKSILLMQYQQIYYKKMFNDNNQVNLINLHDFNDFNDNTILDINEKIQDLHKEYGLIYLKKEIFEGIKCEVMKNPNFKIFNNTYSKGKSEYNDASPYPTISEKFFVNIFIFLNLLKKN